MSKIPFYSLKHQHGQLKDELKTAFNDILDKNWFVLGSRLELFEKEFAAYHHMQFCVGVGNGLDALFLSLKVLGIGQGDEVIVPAHTYIATWLAVSRTGAIPVPIDAHPETFLMDESKIENVITHKTKAIIPVHLYGMPCNMDAIAKIAERHQLTIVEDNAQATGAVFKNKKTGAFGHCNAFSFYPTKNLGALGDGGAVLTGDESYYKQLLAFRNYGQRKRYQAEMKGVNSRLDELQAAFLLTKLPLLEQWNEKRRQLAEAYRQGLSGIGQIKMMHGLEGANPVHHIFPILTSQRDQLSAFLLSEGIETMIHYPFLPFQQDVYREMKIKTGDFPVAESIAKSELSLPIWPGLSFDEVEIICTKIKEFFR